MSETSTTRAAPSVGSVSAPAVEFGRALSALLRSYLEGAGQALADLPGGPRSFHVLSIVAGGNCRSQASIADSLALDRTVMTHLIDDLERAELVARRPDPNDRRARRIVLTSAGRERYDAAAARMRDLERQVLGALDDEEARQFTRLLGRLVSGSPLLEGGACSAPQA